MASIGVIGGCAHRPPAPQVLIPGTYDVELRLSGGRFLSSVRVSGSIELRPVEPSARSDDFVYYGWTDLDLDSMNALCGGEGIPSPRSDDVRNPGVLVRRLDGRYVLSIAGTSHRDRPGWTTYDGCATVLRCTLADRSGFAGEWSVESGYEDAPHGSFRAHRAGSSVSK